jgi:hypothetical protein
MSQPNAPLYWLMPGETPLGPYPVEEILSQIQAGNCTWTTKASLVGSQTWTPLNQLLTLAPVATLASGSEPPVPPLPNPPAAPPSSGGSLFSSKGAKYIIFALAAVVIFFVWGNLGNSSSLSPQQVCRAFFSANSANEVKKYVTPNLYAAVDMLAAQPEFGSEDNAKWELTSEQPAPAQAGGGFYVGYRGHSHDAEGLMTMEGVFHVMDQSGWKVHDWYIFSINGQAVQPPISLAREYEFFRDPQSSAVANRQMTNDKKQAQQWYSNKQLNFVAGVALAKSGLLKWVGAIIGVIVFGVIGFFNKPQAKPAK